MLNAHHLTFKLDLNLKINWSIASHFSHYSGTHLVPAYFFTMLTEARLLTKPHPHIQHQPFLFGNISFWNHNSLVPRVYGNGDKHNSLTSTHRPACHCAPEGRREPSECMARSKLEAETFAFAWVYNYFERLIRHLILANLLNDKKTNINSVNQINLRIDPLSARFSSSRSNSSICSLSGLLADVDKQNFLFEFRCYFQSQRSRLSVSFSFCGYFTYYCR